MKEMNIGDHKVGKDHRTFIIAEIGLNHNGDVDLAKKMIREAKRCGADAAKFQMFNTEELYSRQHDYFEMFESLQFSKEGWTDIRDFAEKEGILFTASVFDKDSADFLHELDSPMFKTASGDLTNIPLLDHISKKDKPTVVSTGLSNISEVEEAVRTFYSNGNEKISLLHCVSNYPSSLENLNLNVIETMKKAFGVPVGFSDHTLDIIAPVTAVALGADIVEKHFTLDREMEGPDQELSLPPDMFENMVKNIRGIEDGLGDGIKKPVEGEKMIKNARRSITARNSIKKGEKITEDDLKITRPERGLKPKFYDVVVGKKMKKTIEEDEPLRWEHL
ncbi:MAG: N-acetylneuraminate synthase family protein [Candidatus Natronoplasma sp.]